MSKVLLITFVLTLISLDASPSHAYAGPGVALGAVLVFFLLVLTFLASVFFSVFKKFKKLFRTKQKKVSDGVKNLGEIKLYADLIL